MAAVNPAFWADKRVLLTGQTGFKGSWAALWLSRMGAKVTGLALPPDQTPALFELAGVERRIDSRLVDLRNPVAVGAALGAALPATDLEDRVMGDASEDAKRKIREIASETVLAAIRPGRHELVEDVPVPGGNLHAAPAGLLQQPR